MNILHSVGSITYKYHHKQYQAEYAPLPACVFRYMFFSNLEWSLHWQHTGLWLTIATSLVAKSDIYLACFGNLVLRKHHRKVLSGNGTVGGTFVTGGNLILLRISCDRLLYRGNRVSVMVGGVYIIVGGVSLHVGGVREGLWAGLGHWSFWLVGQLWQANQLLWHHL